MGGNESKRRLKVIPTQRVKKTPLPIRSVKVRNFRDAKRLLSRLISQLQKDEISGWFAKDLTYLLSQFVVLEKNILNFEHLEEVFEIEFVKNIEFMNASWDILMSEIAEELGLDVLEEIHEKYRTKLLNTEGQIWKKIEKTIDNFRKDKRFPQEILKKTLSYEEVEALILNRCRRLKQTELDNLIEKLTKIGGNNE